MCPAAAAASGRFDSIVECLLVILPYSLPLSVFVNRKFLTEEVYLEFLATLKIS
jgi:hypothetical protein